MKYYGRDEKGFGMKPKNYYGLAFDKDMKKDKRQKKWKKQRKARGFDDTELWNLENTIAKFILPRLQRFKSVSSTYPGGMTPEEWDAKLDKMITAFSLIYDDNYSIDADREAEIEEGLKLFGKYFRALWW